MALLKFLGTSVWMWRMVMVRMGITCRSGVVLTRVRISCGTMISWVVPRVCVCVCVWSPFNVRLLVGISDYLEEPQQVCWSFWGKHCWRNSRMLFIPHNGPFFNFFQLDSPLGLCLEPQPNLEHGVHGQCPSSTEPRRPIRFQQLRYRFEPRLQLSNLMDQVSCLFSISPFPHMKPDHEKKLPSTWQWPRWLLCFRTT